MTTANKIILVEYKMANNVVFVKVKIIFFIELKIKRDSKISEF